MKMLSRLCSVLLCLIAIGLLVTALRPPLAVRTEQTRNYAREAKAQLSGEQAHNYLEQTSEGKSLMQALTAARFGLTWQEHAPGESNSGGGYLGMSHEQNLRAWFGEDGVTVRPTLPEAKRDQTWTTALRLKAYGYGRRLSDVPPIVSRTAKDNRIEYERASSNPQSAIRNPQLVEWYENRAEGIEQGFTLNERPRRSGASEPNESLRVLLAVSGDLRARVENGGNRIELTDDKGKDTLSYSKLVAQDADGKKLAARMEASADGREIELVVEDAAARYPIVIDPLIASLEQKLRSDIPQADARFGTAAAIDGNLAVVGAWREDVGSNADVGAVYVFVRTGTYPNSSWALEKRFGSVSGAGQQCGYSVAISGNRIAYGCPGDNSGKGSAIYFQRNGPNNYSGASVSTGGIDPGDRFGASVAISGNFIVVGSPGAAYATEKNAGAATMYKINADGSVVFLSFHGMDIADAQIGTSVAVEKDAADPNLASVIVGMPGIGAGAIQIIVLDLAGSVHGSDTVRPSDGQTGDQFGQSVAISGNTAVVGAPFNRDRGANAGAAYVFVRNSNGNYSQQQKLLGSDAYTDGDVFGAAHIAIQGNTIAVGAYGWEPTTNLDDDYGKAYIFTRSGTVWTQQATLLGDNHVGDNFGIGLGFSGDSLIVGARGATAVGTARAGAAFVYRLPHTLANISTRLRVETGDNALIGGFIITGSQPKKIIVRAIGPSLGFADKLANPILELHDSSGSLLETNDNWVDSPNKQAIIDSTIPPTNNLESAIVRTLVPGSYTAIVRGVNNGTGIGVVEVYDLNTAVDSILANISTRGLVQGGDNVLIAGTIVLGQGAQKVIIRALGPSVPVPGRLGDPTLELHDSNGALLEANDNWKDSPNKQAIIDSTIPPTNDLESAIVRTLTPAAYTAIVRGVGGTPGIGVVEVYALQ